MFHHLAQPLLPNSHQPRQTWADSGTVEHPRFKSTQPSPREDGTPCQFDETYLGIEGLEELADFRGLWQRRGSLVGAGRLLRRPPELLPQGTGQRAPGLCKGMSQISSHFEVGSDTKTTIEVKSKVLISDMSHMTTYVLRHDMTVPSIPDWSLT